MSASTSTAEVIDFQAYRKARHQWVRQDAPAAVAAGLMAMPVAWMPVWYVPVFMMPSPLEQAN